jgi:predicted ATP-dependent Lon-type protease
MNDLEDIMEVNIIEYSSQYNPHFRPISNDQIITVEISPTGSGKSYFYKDSPNTIMLMPTNTMVRNIVV